MKPLISACLIGFALMIVPMLEAEASPCAHGARSAKCTGTRAALHHRHAEHRSAYRPAVIVVAPPPYYYPPYLGPTVSPPGPEPANALQRLMNEQNNVPFAEHPRY